jgi:flagellum-specific ATP synthase
MNLEIIYFQNAVSRARNRGGAKITFRANVIGYDGTVISSSSFPCVVGSLCSIETSDGNKTTGEVVRIHKDCVEIIPHFAKFPVKIGDAVILLQTRQEVQVGANLLGRVIDGLGHPLDYQNLGEFDALLTIGCGQRLGIIAGSGVGKSVLLSMITKNTAADVIVIGLIGERGREVASFTQEILKSKSHDKVAIVAVPADLSPLLRIQGAKRATTIAEYFRDQGKNVLLIMDSLTRVAHAQRELGLALGEQPTSRGYPPSVISLLPNIIERTGTTASANGSITSIYTVLADGDDINSDPVVDTARAILDGHIVLKRELAQQGIYPAIDIVQSISRLMNDLVDDQHQKNAMQLRKLISKYQENRDLILMGGYVSGQDLDLDAALNSWGGITEFLRQSASENFDFEVSVKLLSELIGYTR